MLTGAECLHLKINFRDDVCVLLVHDRNLGLDRPASCKVALFMRKEKWQAQRRRACRSWACAASRTWALLVFRHRHFDGIATHLSLFARGKLLAHESSHLSRAGSPYGGGYQLAMPQHHVIAQEYVSVRLAAEQAKLGSTCRDGITMLNAQQRSL